MYIDWNFFRSENIQPDDDWSSIILIEVYSNGTFERSQTEQSLKARLLGYVFVIETGRNNALWKLPGGHKKEGETPLDTGRREMKGETGINSPDDAIEYINAKWREQPTGHWNCLNRARIEECELPEMNSNDEENEGEVPKFFSVDEFREAIYNRKFLLYHLQRLSEAHLI